MSTNNEYVPLRELWNGEPIEVEFKNRDYISKIVYEEKDDTGPYRFLGYKKTVGNYSEWYITDVMVKLHVPEKKMVEAKQNLYFIDDYKPHVVEKVKCEICNYKAISIHPKDMDVTKYQCPKCHAMAMIPEGE